MVLGGFTTKPIKNVIRPSRRKSQNQPGLPATPRIFKITAASSDEITRATCMRAGGQTMLPIGQEDLTFRVDQKNANRKASSFDL